jgi:hypothetical protein
MMSWAFAWSFQRFGSSTSEFSSSSRRSAWSQSKMPPQQNKGRLDRPRHRLNFRAHVFTPQFFATKERRHKEEIFYHR